MASANLGKMGKYRFIL